MLLLIICLNHIPEDFLNCLGERTNLLGSELNDVFFLSGLLVALEKGRGKKKYKKANLP